MSGLANLAIQKLNNTSSLDALFRDPFQLPGVQAGFLLSADENPLLSFIKNECIFHPSFSTPFNDHYESYNKTDGVYGCYTRFCQGHNYHPMASNRFFSRFFDVCTNFFNLSFVNRRRRNYGYAMIGVHVFALISNQNCLQYKGPSSDLPLFSKYLFTESPNDEPIEVLRLRENEAASEE